MPHAGTDVPRYRSYSSDLRERVVYQRCTLKYKIKEISTSLNMSQRVVERVLKLWRETGEVVNEGPGRAAKRCRVMDNEEIEVRSSLISSISVANGSTSV